MKMKSKPIRPMKKEHTEYMHIDGEVELLDIINHFGKLRIDASDVSIVVEPHDWDESLSVYAAGSRMESDEEYSKRLLQYEKKLAEYNQWYKDNKEQIVAEISKRKEEIIKKKEAILLKAKQTAERALAKLQKRLDK